MRVKLSCHKKMHGCAVNVVPATRREFLNQYAKELDYVSRFGGDVSECYYWRMKLFPLRCPACGRVLQSFVAHLKNSDVLELGCMICEYGYPVHFFTPGFTYSDVFEDNTLGISGGDRVEE